MPISLPAFSRIRGFLCVVGLRLRRRLGLDRRRFLQTTGGMAAMLALSLATAFSAATYAAWWRSW